MPRENEPTTTLEPDSQQPDGTATANTRTQVRRRKRNGLYDQIVLIVGSLAAYGICAALWVAGARFTLDWFAAQGIPVWNYGIWAWGIPAGLTALELAFMPVIRHRDLILSGLWLAIAGFDVYTSVVGAIPWVQQQDFISFVPGIDITLASAIVIGLTCALVPEPLARYIWQKGS